MSSDDPLKEAESQIFFITNFAKPLLELTARVVPELSLYSTVCKQNLKTWTRIKADLLREKQISANTATKICGRPPSTSSSPTSPPPSQLSSPPPLSPRRFDYYHSAFPLTLPTFHLNLPSDHSFPPSCLGRSDNEPISFPDSPTESESVTSSTLSPISDSSSSKCPSALALSQINDLSMPPLQNTPHEAIRMASRLGSLPRFKKDAKGKKGSRNSWSVATSAMAGGLATLFHPPSSPSDSSGPTSTHPTVSTDAPIPPIVHPPPSPSGGFLIARPLKLQVSP